MTSTTATTTTTTTATTMTTKPNTNNKKKNKTVATTAPESSRNMVIFETIWGNEVWAKKKATNNKDDSESTITKVPLQGALKQKEFVALYFGAQWSKVSTEFTPHLVNFYEQANVKNPNTLEIVYVSSDQSQEEFVQHYGRTMPWLSVVADDADTVKKRNDLIPLFKAFRVPCMVLLHGPTGQFITEHAVKDINKWQPPATDKKTDDDTKNTSPSISDILEQWRNTSTKSIQDANKLIDYGGGTMSFLMFFYRNPYVICALIAIAMYTSIVQAIMKKPMVLIGFLFLGKRYLTPKGDQNLPGQLVTMESQESSADNKNSDNERK